MPVEIKATDLVTLGLATTDDIEGSLKKLAQKLKREGFIKNYRSSTELFMLEQVRGRDCIFLDENRLCRVYDKRPEVCRKFPDVGPRPGFCPARPKNKSL